MEIALIPTTETRRGLIDTRPEPWFNLQRDKVQPSPMSGFEILGVILGGILHLSPCHERLAHFVLIEESSAAFGDLGI